MGPVTIASDFSACCALPSCVDVHVYHECACKGTFLQVLYLCDVMCTKQVLCMQVTTVYNCVRGNSSSVCTYVHMNERACTENLPDGPNNSWSGFSEWNTAARAMRMTMNTPACTSEDDYEHACVYKYSIESDCVGDGYGLKWWSCTPSGGVHVFENVCMIVWAMAMWAKWNILSWTELLFSMFNMLHTTAM
jgi:hypothetical protein